MYIELVFEIRSPNAFFFLRSSATQYSVDVPKVQFLELVGETGSKIHHRVKLKIAMIH